jgi:hypothetical protein
MSNAVRKLSVTSQAVRATLAFGSLPRKLSYFVVVEAGLQPGL